MPALSSLKLIAAKKPAHMPPVVQRRNKVINRIWEQIQLAEAAQEGKKYSPTRLRTVTDKETGEVKSVQMPKRVKEWWFVSDTGKLCVSIKYGQKIIELGAKGKTAVELTDAAGLVPTLEVLRQAAENGELDAAIEAVSGAIKSTIKK